MCVKEMIKQIVTGGNTANLAALDTNKALPRVNHDGLTITLTKRNVPELLNLAVS